MHIFEAYPFFKDADMAVFTPASSNYKFILMMMSLILNRVSHLNVLDLAQRREGFYYVKVSVMISSTAGLFLIELENV